MEAKACERLQNNITRFDEEVPMLACLVTLKWRNWLRFLGQTNIPNFSLYLDAEVVFATAKISMVLYSVKTYLYLFSVEFDIDSNSGIVRLASSIANGEARYSVDIMARDKGDPPLNSSYTLQINVEAANLNDPVFNNLPPTDRISIKEVSLITW